MGGGARKEWGLRGTFPEPEPGDAAGGATSPPPSEWTSVRIGPGEDVVGQDVLAVRVLVTSDDSRYAPTAVGRGRDGLGRQLWGASLPTHLQLGSF